MNKNYVCPQCGPDVNGGDVHALTHHTFPPMSVADLKPVRVVHDPRLPWRFEQDLTQPYVTHIFNAAGSIVTGDDSYDAVAPVDEDMKFIVHSVNAHRQLIDAAKLLLNVYEGRRCGSLRQSVDEQNLRKLIAECNHE